MWLYSNIPYGFEEVRSEKAFYSQVGFSRMVTPPPQCMDKKYHHPNILVANFNNYKHEKLSFARWKREGALEAFHVAHRVVSNGTRT
jgi:hypothetical protein